MSSAPPRARSTGAASTGAGTPRWCSRIVIPVARHAHGTAIDVNAAYNRIKKVPALRGTGGSVRELADLCADFGIVRGGWYGKRKDGMHFECVTLQTEAQLRAACTKHGFELEDVRLDDEYLPKKKA